MAALCNRGENDVFETNSFGYLTSELLSGDDTESVYSLQGKETELVKDTSDTEGSSCESIIDIELEYDVASLSDNDDIAILDSSSGDEDFLEIVIANAICDTSLDTWATDNESSDNSMDDSRFRQVDFVKCVQCGGANKNSQYRYCEKCFQIRKNIFPPRPQTKFKKRNVKKKFEIKKSIQNYLKTESFDSGIGTSQELSSLETEENKEAFESRPSSSNVNTKIEPQASHNINKRKRDINTNSDSDISDNEESSFVRRKAKRKLDNVEDGIPDAKRSKLQANVKSEIQEQQISENKEKVEEQEIAENKEKVEEKEISENKEKVQENSNLCIICNANSKNSIFLHGSIGHMSCCYKCAMATWKTNKRCPICNCKVNKVVKVFSTC